MQKFSLKLTVLLLAFSVGVALVSVFYFRASSAPVPLVEPVAEDETPPAVADDGRKRLEMVFVLDTTGSMGGLLEGAKQKVWGIVNDVMQRQSRPSVRVGLVAYRDRGDDYVTEVLPLTDDLDRVYMTLMDYEASGGGDHPENVRRALADGLDRAGWSASRGGVAQIIFLVGDAPPQNYENEPDVLATAAAAVSRNVIVNTIQCGADAATARVWRQIAERGQGRFFTIAQDGGVATIETPYDQRLAELGRRIGQTYTAYGANRGAANSNAAMTEARVANTSSNSTKADRTLNKALNKDAYRDDLLQDVEKGVVAADSVKAEELPDELARLSAPERKAEIDKRLAERQKIREEILTVSKQRDEFLRAERQKKGKTGGFDAAVQEALAEQLKRRGIQ